MLCVNKLVLVATITLIIISGTVMTPAPVDDKRSNIDGKGKLILQI